MLPNEKVMCHRTAFEKSCFDMVTRCKCQLWIGVHGVNPNTGVEIDRYECGDKTASMQRMEIASLIDQVAGSLQSERNEIIKRLDVSNLQTAHVLLSNKDCHLQLGDGAVRLVAETTRLIENKSDG